LLTFLFLLLALELLAIRDELEFSVGEGSIERIRANKRDRSGSAADGGGGSRRGIGLGVSDLALFCLLSEDLLAKRSEIEFGLGQRGVKWVAAQNRE
jgi:hypothetical protein